MAKNRPPGGRPSGRIGRGGIGPPAGRYPGGGTRNKKIGGGGAGKPPSSGGGKKKGACDMWLPIAIPATLFYAMPRMLVDDIRGWWHAKGRPGNQRPRSGRGPAYRRPGGGGGGGGYKSKGPKGGMSAGVVGPVKGIVYAVAGLATLLVGTPVAVIVYRVIEGG